MKKLGSVMYNDIIECKEGYFSYDVSLKQYVKRENLSDEKKRTCGGLNVKGEIFLEGVSDIDTYSYCIKEICDELGITKKKAFVNINHFVSCIFASKVTENDLKIKDNKILETIDESSGGGLLIAKKGKYEGKYRCYDINNSYNAFFVDYNFPTNPTYYSIKEIVKVNELDLYKCKVDAEFLTDEWNNKLKTRRTWFTGIDLKLFGKLDIGYSLVDEENNVIKFDTVDIDTEFITKINKLKQRDIKIKRKQEIWKATLKQLLSSMWGVLSKFNIVEEKEGSVIDGDYFYKTDPITGVDKFKNPECIFAYPTATAKPFILAYGRSRLMKKVYKCEEDGYKVVYCHTDSIITNAPKKYFDIGLDIGEWKIDHETKEGIEVVNIGSKRWSS